MNYSHEFKEAITKEIHTLQVKYSNASSLYDDISNDNMELNTKDRNTALEALVMYMTEVSQQLNKVSKFADD